MKNKPEDKNNEKTISRRDALKRIAKTALGAAGIVAVASCDIFYEDYYDYYDYYSNYYSNYYYNYYSDYYDYYYNYSDYYY